MTRRVAALVGGAALLAASASAQVAHRRAPDLCRLPVVEAAVPAALRAARPARIDCDPASVGARFEVEYTGFPPGAEEAFQAAVDTWACRIRSTETIRVSALWAPLDAGTLAMASLDTVTPEPLPEGHWLYAHPKVRLSAHVSWSMPDAYAGLIDPFVTNLQRFMDGEALIHQVNVEEGY